MEEFFCLFSDFFIKKKDCPKGKGDDSPYKSHKIRRQIAQAENPAAEQGKIDRRSRQHAQNHIDPHFPVPRRHRVDKQGGGGRRPEQQIQHSPHSPQADTHPDHPEHVVQHAHRAAQQHRPAEEGRLSRY